MPVTTHTRDVDDALALAQKAYQDRPPREIYIYLQLGKAIVFALLLIAQAIDNK